MRDCIGERLTLEVAVRYEPCKLIKIHNFGCKVSLVVCSCENMET